MSSARPGRGVRWCAAEMLAEISRRYGPSQQECGGDTTAAHRR